MIAEHLSVELKVRVLKQEVACENQKSSMVRLNKEAGPCQDCFWVFFCAPTSQDQGPEHGSPLCLETVLTTD